MKLVVAMIASAGITALIFVALGSYGGSEGSSAAPDSEEPQPETPSGAAAESEVPLPYRLDECTPEDEDCIRELVALYHPEATYSGGGFSALAGRTQYYFEGSENVPPCEFLDWSTQRAGGPVHDEPGYYEIRIEGVEDGCVIPTPQFE